MEKLVLRLLPDGDVVAPALQGGDQNVGVLLVRDGGDLDESNSAEGGAAAATGTIAAGFGADFTAGSARRSDCEVAVVAFTGVGA